MTGIGEIYQPFHAAALADDDEVAVLHGPAEVDYVPVTEAMVNVRATINRALQLEVVTPPTAATLLGIAKSLFYKERTYEAILSNATALGVSQNAVRCLAAWLPEGRIDQKRLDALEMVEAMVGHLSRGVAPLQVTYRMAHTFAWEYARQRAESVPD